MTKGVSKHSQIPKILNVRVRKLLQLLPRAAPVNDRSTRKHANRQLIGCGACDVSQARRDDVLPPLNMFVSGVKESGI